MNTRFMSHLQVSSPAPEYRTPLSSKLSAKHKSWLAALLVAASPVFGWLLLSLFVIGGCKGSPNAGIDCPPIFGFDFQALATSLTLFSINGFAISVPLGLALLISIHFLSQKRKW